MPDDQNPPADQPPQNQPYGQQQQPYGQPPPSYGQQQPPHGQPPPPYGQPPAWPPPPGGYYAPVPQAPPVNSTLILVFGILGIVTTLGCGIGGIFGIVAWVMGNSALQTLDQIGDPMGQRGTVNAGRICGIIGAAMMAIGILGYAAFMGYVIYDGAHHPSSK